jgi:hypothetical protein
MVPPPLKETAFAVAGDLLFADGVVAPEEMQVLKQIQAARGVLTRPLARSSKY